jgi:hypothetical protein
LKLATWQRVATRDLGLCNPGPGLAQSLEAPKLMLVEHPNFARATVIELF